MIKNLFALFITILFHSITFSQSNNLDSISIVGPNIVCQGLNNQYKTNKVGGYWTTSDRDIARIDTTTGWLTSVNPGKVTIQYLAKNSNQIITFKRVIILSNQPIQLSVVNKLVCVGSNIDIITNPSSTGVWSSLNPIIASVGSNGNVTGLNIGTATIKYLSKLNGTCSDSVSTLKIEVINSFPDSNLIIGSNRICSNSIVQYSTKFPNNYSYTSDSTILNISGNSAFSRNPGKATLFFKLNASGSCPSKTVNFDVEVYQNPAKLEIKGENILCVNCNGYLKTPVNSYRGIWTSNNPKSIMIDSLGSVNTLGVDTATIYYTVRTTSECPSYKNAFKIKVINNNDILKLSGNQTVDLEKSVFFKSSSPLKFKNYWYSCDSTIASVNAITGEVVGRKPGNTTILYRSGSGSFDDTVSTRTIEVFSPAYAGNVSGNQNICVGSSTQLSSTNPRGVWSTSNLNIVEVSKSGLVTGIKGGTETIFYKIIDPNGVHDSISSISITVQENLIIHVTNRIGIDRVCVGDTAYLNANLSGGTWTSQNSDIANIEFYNRASTKNEGNVLINYKLNKSSFCKDSIATKKLNVVLPKMNLTTSNVVINGYISDTVVLRASILNDSVKQNAMTYYWKINGSIFTTNTAFYKTRLLKSYDTLSVYYQTNYSTSNICSQNKTIVSNKIVYTLDSTKVKSTACDINVFSINNPSVNAIISGTNITLNVPVGTDITKLIAQFTVSTGATVKVGITSQTSGQTTNDFTKALSYVVTAEDGTTKTYRVTVIIDSTLQLKSPACEITHYKINGVMGTISGSNITLTLAPGTDVTKLIAEFSLSAGASVKIGTLTQVSGSTQNNFSSPINYTVTAEDGTQKSYTISIVFSKRSEKDILSFGFLTVNSMFSATGNHIKLAVPKGIDKSKLIGQFSLSQGATAKIGTTIQVSEQTVNNFTDTVNYIITAEDGTSKLYKVYLTERMLSSEKDISWFNIDGGAGKISGSDILVPRDKISDITSCIARFTISPFASIKIGDIVQVSGITKNNLSSPITYTVVAEDRSTQNYTVSTEKKSGKDILTFGFSKINSIFSMHGNYVNLSVPTGTKKSNLLAQFSLSQGATAKIGTTIQVTDQTVNDFTDTVNYMITAEDGTSKLYKVYLTERMLSSEKDISWFNIDGVLGTIKDSTIILSAQKGKIFDLTKCLAQFNTSSFVTVKVGNVTQISGITTNNFSSPVLYTLTAEDGTIKNYLVKVVLDSSSQIKSSLKDITVFGFVNPSVNGVITGTNITLNVPAGTDITKLIAQFTVSAGATVKVFSVNQLSGQTANDFTNVLNYIVTAEDGTSKTYTVSVKKMLTKSSSCEITAFSFTTPAVTGIITGTNITLNLPKGTDIIKLIAQFTVSAGATVKVLSVNQVSGQTVNDFTNVVSYLVTAEDGITIKTYTIKVNIQPALISGINCDSTSFHITGPYQASRPTITYLNVNDTLKVGKSLNNINCNISYYGGNGGAYQTQVINSTGVTGLTATLTSGTILTGNGRLNYLISGTPSSEGVAAFDMNFGGKSCSIKLNVKDTSKSTLPTKSSACEITAFSFTTPAVTGIITGTNITLNLPKGTDIIKLIAQFTVSAGATVKVLSVNQVSGQTVNDFTNVVSYLVTAEDGITIKTYTIKVNIQQQTQSTEKSISEFTIKDLNIKSIISDTNITLFVKSGIDLTLNSINKCNF